MPLNFIFNVGISFSIVITVFNKEKYIADTIQSVLDQSFQNFEIIILNDGSTDGSEKEILKFKDTRIKYFSQENKGASAARNAAIKKANNQYIALLDADDYWYPFYLEEQKKSISLFPEEKLFATAAKTKNGNQIFDNSYSINNMDDQPVKVNYFESSFKTSLLHSSSMVVDKSIFEEVGWYNTNYKSGEDIDLYVRMGLKHPVIFNPKICAIYIIRKNSLVSAITNLKEKAQFEEYEKEERENTSLKRFLDLNRYSLAVAAIINKEDASAEKLIKKINLENLSASQKFLLNQNRQTLLLLLKTKNYLSSYGLRLGTFK